MSQLQKLKVSNGDFEQKFIGAHSLGGVMTQLFLKSDSKGFSGVILMGTVVLRD
jgi:alpha-beta hydrolase superfamily lysophospholipase